MTSKFEEALNIVNSHMAFYKSVSLQLDRIITLVQRNQAFFDDPILGQCCVRAAADKLEKLVKEFNAK